GQDVRGLRQADLRRAGVLVPQQAVLFEGTLRGKLLYAAPDARGGDVRRVLGAGDLGGAGGGAAAGGGGAGGGVRWWRAGGGRWGSAASACRAASGSGWRWPGPC